jgi:multicomponent Na+:H+ antiporter subunit A
MLVWLVARVGPALDGDPIDETTAWVPALGLTIDLRLDGMAGLMVLLVSGIGVLVLAYSAAYLPAAGAEVGRLVGLLVLFSGAMLLLVLADNLLLLYTGWELTSIASYLLIGNSHIRTRARAAALQALLVTSAGGLVMLGGFVLLGQAAGSFRLSEILTDPPSGTAATVALFLILAGAFTKSAQYPFHFWLPGAMVASTPVSTYLHSATMVTAGVYLVARLAPVFALTAGWRPVVLTVGLVTMVLGGLRALRRYDLKLLLAFGTVSQLGLMMILLGAGTPEATTAGCTLLLAHAVFKAALFMVVGMIDHETGTRDIRALHRLGRGWRAAEAIAVVSAASMAGVPLAFGFVAKEAAFEAFSHGDFAGGTLVLAGIVAGAILTFAYSARLVWGLLRPWPADAVAPPPPPASAERPPSLGLVLPAAFLAVVSVMLEIAPGLANDLIGGAARSLDPAVGDVELKVWHGVNLALVLTGVTIAAGTLVFVVRQQVANVLALGYNLPSAATAYLRSLRGLNVAADRVTGVVQNGSLPFYAGVIILTAAVVPGIALLTGAEWPGWPDLVDAPEQVPIVAVMLGCALGAAAVRRRFAAALLLGTVGYAMAGLFVVQGAPDLALTQVTIETLSTVLFVLVLRRLPDRFEHRAPAVGRALRVLLGCVVAVAVFAFAVIAGASRSAPPVSDAMVDRSLPDGGGRNVVNVILVDFRGFDTLGEITVLVAAAVGAVALARAGRRPRRVAERADDVAATEPAPGTGAEHDAVEAVP